MFIKKVKMTIALKISRVIKSHFLFTLSIIIPANNASTSPGAVAVAIILPNENSEFVSSINSDTGSVSPNVYSQLGTRPSTLLKSAAALIPGVDLPETYEFVSECKFKDNIYTMNYGHPDKFTIDSWGIADEEKIEITEKAYYSDIFGHYTDNNEPKVDFNGNVGKKRGNKNYFRL